MDTKIPGKHYENFITLNWNDLKTYDDQFYKFKGAEPYEVTSELFYLLEQFAAKLEITFFQVLSVDGFQYFVFKNKNG